MRKNGSRFAAAGAVLLSVSLLSAPVIALAQSAPAARPLVAGVSDSALLSNLRFRALGPAVMSGRIADIAVPAAQRPGERLGKIVYVATAAGGVWKTTNAGVTWLPIFDAQRVSSIGAVAVAPSNPDIVWVGTGESNNLRSSSWGDGIYRSADAGATWTHMGLRASQHIARIVVHPTNADIVFVAASGPLWTSGGERGLYRTTDGGRTWQLLKALGPFTGFTDIVLDPSQPDVIYAAAHQRERKAYSFVAGGSESGIWKSTDGGATWAQLSNGLPSGDVGRIGIAVARSRPTTLYATVDARAGGVFRSDDAGASWTRTSSLQSIPWFFGQIRIDPQNPERVYHLGVSLQASDDGGRTFRSIAQNTHADHHALWIDPLDPDHLIIGNDGGLYFSHDAGRSWDFALNLPVSTFYAIGVDMRAPYWVYGGLQDNGTWGAPVRTLGRTGPGNAEWVRASGGDGFYAAIDPHNPNIIFVESQNGSLRRFDFATQESKPIRPTQPAGLPPLRYNWSAPLLISPHDSRTLYFAANVLFRSRDHGDSWEVISGDLTRQLDRDTLPIMGLSGPGGYRRHEGTAEFGNIATIDESRVRAGLLYAGTDDGLVHVTRDGGRTWQRIDRFPGVPAMTYVSRVVASAHDEGTVYVTFDGHRNNDFRPYVLRSSDFGRTFTSLAGGLGDAGSVYVIREHPRNRDLLFAGAEYGVFVSIDGGRSWTRLQSGLAPAPVHDLIVHPRDHDLVVGTHGRGIFVLDDLTPLERLAAVRRTNVAAFFPPRPALIYNPRATPAVPGHRNYTTPNPPAGAALTYFVAPAAPRDMQAALVILDESGGVVRELPAPLEPGIQRVQWDLRYTPPSAAAPAARGRDDDEEDTPRAPGAPAGPLVLPGTYQVQLRSAARVLTETRLQVLRDPAVVFTAAQLTDLHDLRLRVYATQRSIIELIARLEDGRRHLHAAAEGRDSVAAAPVRALGARVDSALARLRAARREGPPGAGGAAPPARAQQPLLTRASALAATIGSVHFPPTAEQRATLAEVDADLERERAAADALLHTVGELTRGATSG